jgi:serine/threonine protein kinase
MSHATTLPRKSGPRLTIGPYAVVGRPLGRGGMATVYQVEDTEGRPFAVKEFMPSLAADRELVRRFRQEFQILSQLSHPNLVRVLELFEANGTLNIRMEYLEAVSLKAVLKAVRPLPPVLALAIGARVAGALAYVHEKGILHRDVKPANILITNAGRVKLTDFGVARAGRGTHTMKGAVIGTPAYLAPEQLSGRLDLGPPADIYSLGMVLFEMFEGRLPYPAGRRDGLVEMVEQRMTRQPRSATRIQDPQVLELVNACLSPSPSSRPQSAKAVHDLLAALDGPAPERAIAQFLDTKRTPVRSVGKGGNEDDSEPTRLTLVFHRGLSALSTLIIAGSFLYLLLGWPFTTGPWDIWEWFVGLIKAILGNFSHL